MIIIMDRIKGFIVSSMPGMRTCRWSLSWHILWLVSSLEVYPVSFSQAISSKFVTITARYVCIIVHLWWASSDAANASIPVFHDAVSPSMVCSRVKYTALHAKGLFVWQMTNPPSHSNCFNPIEWGINIQWIQFILYYVKSIISMTGCK